MAAQMPTNPLTPLQAKKLAAQLGLDPNAYGSTARGQWTNQALADALGVNIIKSGSTGGRTLATPTANQPAPTSESLLADVTKFGDTQYRMMQSPLSYLTDKGKQEFASYTAPRQQEQLQSKATELGITPEQMNAAYNAGQQHAHKADQDFIEWRRKNAGLDIPTWFKLASAAAGAHMVGSGFLNQASSLAPSAVGAGATAGGAAVPAFGTPFTAQQLGQIGAAAVGSYNNPQRGNVTSMVNTIFPSPFKGAPSIGDLEIFEKAKKSIGLDNVQPFAKGGKYDSEARQSFPREALSALKKIYGEGASNLESILRGSVAAVPGVVGDIESLFRDSDKTRKFATTEEVLRDYMPRRFLSPTKEASGFEQVGTFVPLPIPTGTVSKGAELIKQGAKAAAPYAARSAVNLAEKYGVAPTMNVVKPKGGNWLAGHIEYATQPLRVDPEAQAMAAMRRAGVNRSDAELREIIQAQPLSPENAAANRWIDTKLSNYIRNEMATPEDPIRALAERGVLHVDPEQLNYRLIEYGKHPQPGQEFLAKSDAAKLWEGVTDNAIATNTAGDQSKFVRSLENNPWLTKVPPETKIYGTVEGENLASDLGFDHLIDELKFAMSPDSGLPNNLRIDPSKIDKLTVPQAVERVSQINAWRAEQAAKAEREGMMANLQAKPRLPDEDLQLSFVEKPGGAWVDIPETVDETGMKLCSSIGKAGGWCTQSAWAAKGYGSGKNRLTALVDAEGRPHAQAKITKDTDELSAFDSVIDKMTPEQETAYMAWANELDAPPELDEAVAWMENNAPEVYRDYQQIVSRQPTSPPDITELKPVGNTFESDRAKEYMKRDPQYKQKVTESVLKFLNSGDWGNVKDLHHYDIVDLQRDQTMLAQYLTHITGKDARSAQDIFNAAVDANPDTPRFMTPRQLRDLIRSIEPAEGFAAGGLVSYDPDEIDRLAQSTLQGYAEGGKAKEPSPFEGLEPTLGEKAGAYISDKTTEGLLWLYDKLADRDKLSSSHKILLDTFVHDKRDPITAKDFSERDLAELQNLIKQKEKLTGKKGAGSIQYKEYETLPGGDQKRAVQANLVGGNLPPRTALSTSLGQFNYKLDPKTGRYVIIDEYDFNPQQITQMGKKYDVPLEHYGDYMVDALSSPGNALYSLVRLYAGRKMPPGQGRKVDLSVPKYAAGGLVDYDPNEIDTIVSQLKEEFHG